MWKGWDKAMKQVYICTDTMTGLGSALYDAWKESRDREAGIELRGKVQQQLFCEYKTVVECEDKAVKIAGMIKRHLGYNAYWDICNALLSDDSAKGEAVFHAMQEARRIPDSRKIMEHLGHPDVAKVFELSRRVSNEAHRYKEFIRFRELKNGVLFSEISPRAQILTCIAEHFSNRFPLENWMICDKTHGISLVHPARDKCRLVWGVELNPEAAGAVSDAEEAYETLWRVFFESISIKERENPGLQRNMLPLRYRGDMPEFWTDRSES